MGDFAAGPWEVRHFPYFSDHRPAICFRVFAENGTLIAPKVRGLDMKHGGDAEANARLIAAAPDLLEACKATVSAYSSHQLYDKCPMAMLEAAIAKATGKEQT